MTATPINDLMAKIDFLLTHPRPSWVSGCQLRTIPDLARTIGVAPTTLRDHLQDNDIGTRHEPQRRKPMPEHLQRMIGYIFKFDVNSDVWRKGDRRDFQKWYDESVFARRRNTTQPLRVEPLRQPEHTRFAGLCALRLDVSLVGVRAGCASLAAEVQSRDFDHGDTRYRTERVELEVHLWPANISEDDWKRWSDGQKFTCSPDSPHVTVRAIGMPEPTKRHEPAPDDEKPNGQDWIRTLYFKVDGHSDEIGIAQFEIGSAQKLAGGDTVWAAVGVRQRDVNPVPVDRVVRLHTLRRGGLSPLKKCAINAILKQELFRDADGYFVACWHAISFKEAVQ